MIEAVACAKCGKHDGNGRRYWSEKLGDGLVCPDCAEEGMLRCDYPLSAIEHRIATALERIAMALEKGRSSR